MSKNRKYENPYIVKGNIDKQAHRKHLKTNEQIELSERWKLMTSERLPSMTVVEGKKGNLITSFILVKVVAQYL